jgi:hypothetical protein
MSMNMAHIVTIRLQRVKARKHSLLCSLVSILHYTIYLSFQRVTSRLTMMGRDWRIRTAAFTSLFFIPGDLRCEPWMMILFETNSQLVYQSALAAPRAVRRSCQQRNLWQPQLQARFLSSETSLERVGGGRRKCLTVPVGLQEVVYMP